MKKTAKKKVKKLLDIIKKHYLVVLMVTLLTIGLVIYLSFGKVLPNDKIAYPEEGSVAMLLNENPKFRVGFGNVEQPEKPWVRFEADTSLINPFKDEKISIFKRIANLFRKKKRKGIEMSLTKVDVAGVENMGVDVKSVAESSEDLEIKTSTELANLGREFGSYKENISKKTVRNINVVEGIDLEYQILEGYGVKEEIVINSLEEYNKGCKKDDCKLPSNQFEFEIKMDEGVTFDASWYTIDGKSTQSFYFLDEDGKYVAHFLPTWAIDSQGSKTYDVKLDLREDTGKYIAVVTVDPEWLLSKDRIFPVRIDPSIVHDDKESFDLGTYERVRFSYSGGYKIRLDDNESSGIYTSDEVSLDGVTTLNSITWTPVGVQTGDAETPYSTTGLVAQWDLNETSGTTASSGGSCGASCNGTLTNMTTTSQDAAVNSGWTANNRKWGAGALAFDGSNDSVSFGIHKLGPTINGASSVTMELWIKVRGAYPTAGNTYELLVISNSGGGSVDSKLDENGKVTIGGRSTAADAFQNVISNSSLEMYSWNHVIGIFDYPNDTISIYINGKLDKTQSVTFAATSYTDSANASWHDALGNLTSYSRYFNGIMDSVRLYSRALSVTEIISNYQVGNIEFEYRTSANGSTWSSWTGGTEVSMETLDLYTNYGDGADGALAPSGTFNLNSSTSGARSYADGIAYKVASNPAIGTASIVTVDTPNGLATGDDILLINLQGSYTDFLDVGNYEILTINSVDTGTKTITTTTNIRKTYQGSTFANQKIVIQRIPNYTSVTLDNTDSITASAWDSLATTPTSTAGYYTGIVAFRANGTVTIGSGTSITALGVGYQGGTPPSAYVGGTGGSSFCGSGGAGGVNGGTLDGTAGAGGGGGSYSGGDGALGYCGGGGAGAASAQPAGVGSVRQGGAGGGASSGGGGGGGAGYGTAGNGGLGYNAAGSNGGTETSGDGATGPSGTAGNGGGGGGTYGYANLDRLYYGSGGGGGGGYTGYTPGSGGKGGGIIFIMADTVSVSGTISVNGANGGDGNSMAGGGGGGAGGSMKIVGDSLTLGSSLVTATGGSGGISGVGGGGTGGSGRIYVASPVTMSGTTSPTATTKTVETTLISEGTESQNISTSENVVTYQLSSKDISTYTKIPFWVASDKQGNVGDIIYSESLFANYLPDGNTIASWHMDETANNSCNDGSDVCDSSEQNYHGTETGTDILATGYLGSGRTFSAGDDISLGNISLVDGLANMTIDAWIYPTQQTAATHYRVFTENYVIYVGQYANQVSYYLGNGSSWTTSDQTGGNLKINAWNHVAWVKSGTSASIYINGQLGKSGITAPATLASTANVNYISTYDGTTQPWIGNLDEVRISNVARTAGEIRQAYEMGSRTHPININFKADLQSDNLISDINDKSFRISEVNYGALEAVENLNIGDKIIIKESTYKAQGTIDSINTGIGAVTVSNWDTGSTVPGGGYTTNAVVYKWQREFIDTRWHISSLLDGINTITFRKVDSNATVLLDDFKVAKYSSDYTATSFTPIDSIKYVQYRAIFSTWDEYFTPYITSVQMDYEDMGEVSPTLDLLMRHGKWFNSSGEKQPFWWVD